MIAIVSMVGTDAGVGLHTPKLNVPEDFKVRYMEKFSIFLAK